MTDSLNGSGLMLPSSELVNADGICKPAEPGCSPVDRCASGIWLSKSWRVTTDERSVPDFRFCGFCIGLCLALAAAATLLGVATFLFDFFDCEVTGSGSVMPSLIISTSMLGSTGDVAFELGAVLGLVM